MVFFGNYAVLQFFLLTVLYLLIKKYKRNRNTHPTNFYEEDFINSYNPERLVVDSPNSHEKSKNYIVEGKVGEFIDVDGMKCVNFATHDYLGFIGKKDIEIKAIGSIENYGVGTCGPRCFYGTNMEHLKLEAKLADFLSTESSIIYPFGFATVASVIPAYAKEWDVIFVDEKRNFAIQQGLVASRSLVLYFKHNDPESLKRILSSVQLQKMKIAKKSKRFLVLEGIYTNTGEICNVPEFLKISKMYKLRVFIDECVSFGVLGKTGRGILEYFDIPRTEVDLTMGSFEHSLASVGGFCAGSKYLIEHQVLSGLGYCFSASLPVCHVTAASAALDLIQEDSKIIEKLGICCKIMHDKLTSSDEINSFFHISGDPESPVHFLSVKNYMLPQHFLQDKAQLLNNFVESCRKENIAIVRSARLNNDNSLKDSLKITTSVYHSESRIEHLITTLQDVCKNFKV